MKTILVILFLPLALALNPSQSNTDDIKLYRDAKMAKKIKDYDEAAKLYGKLYREYPDSNFAAHSRFYNAYCLERAGQWAKALKAYKEALEADPKSRHADDMLYSIISLSKKLRISKESKDFDFLIHQMNRAKGDVKYVIAYSLAKLDFKVAHDTLMEGLKKAKSKHIRTKIRLLILAKGSKADKEKLPETEQKVRSNISGRILHVSIFGKSSEEPYVKVNVPVAFALALFNNLPPHILQELEKDAKFDLRNIFESLNHLEKNANILEIKLPESGDHIRIWIEG